MENPLDEQMILKADRLRERGVPLYPERVPRDRTVGDVVAHFDELLGATINIAGRITAKREHGKIVFCTLEERDGAIQVIFTPDVKQPDLVPSVDLGDILSVSGTIAYSQTKEKSIVAKEFAWGAKALRPLPKDHYKISDEETLVRKPYLATLLYPERRAVFEKRSVIIQEIRKFLTAERFTEVETPVLQGSYGGALATPFVTHLNALDIDLYLRIAPEIYLKKMIVGNLERIFEIGKNFRNEGADREHNPEFTTLEFYAAWEDRRYLMDFTERLTRAVVHALHGGSSFAFRGATVGVSKPFSVVRFTDALKEHTGLDYFASTLDDFARKVKTSGIETNLKVASKGKLADELFKKVIRPTFVQPTFLVDHPKDLMPLAKERPDDPRLTLTMQFFMGGTQLVTSYAELNDPREQKRRFEEQRAMLQAGDAEAHPYDATFIEALEYGMPPTAGYGLGIDRFVMVLLNQESLKDVIYFPFVR